MFFNYKKGDVVKYSLSKDENYILIIKKRKFYKKYSGLAIPLEKWRIGPGREKYSLKEENLGTVNPKVCSIKFVPKKGIENRIHLDEIKEKFLSPINSREIDLDDLLGKCV